MVNSLVVKSNDLVEARYKLNLNEQKIILYAVSKLDREQDNFNLLSLEVKEFTELLGTGTDRYGEIREVVRELRKKEVIIDAPGGEIITGWLSSIQNKDGVIELEFSQKLIPYLLQLKECFTRYQLKNILYLKNKYSIRIYELMKQYQTIGHRQFTIEELKDLLMIGDKYSEFKDFNKYVIKATMEEINTHTDINIDIKLLKRGRKVVAVKYIIQSKEQEYINYLNENYPIKQFKIQCGLDKENFNSKQVIELFEIATDVLEDAEQEQLFDYIKLNYNFMIQKKGITNKFAYLKKCLREDLAVARGQIKFNFRL